LAGTAGQVEISTREAQRVGLAPQGLPPTVRAAFEPVSEVAEAEAYTRGLTHSHYENFSVVSVLLPKHLRQDFCNVYSFCRIADDLGDEVGDRAKALEYLGAFRRQLIDCYAGRSETAVFVALAATIKRHDIPMKSFDDLIRAFEQDQTVTRYSDFAQVVDYCSKSADPVGRIVLYMCGHRDEGRQLLSDKICTALQMINFWQDVRRDILERDRIYLPADDMAKFGVTEAQLREGRVTEGFRELIKFEVERTEVMFAEGAALLPLLERRVRKQIALFRKGGLAICTAVRRQNFDTLTKRPRLSKFQKLKLVLGTMIGGGR
jgi:squalene synthase HpnC